jgi:hypothetical protein
VQSTRTGRTGYVPIDYLEPAQKAANKPKASPPSASVNSVPKAPPPSSQPNFESPEANQGVRMSLSSLLDKAKTTDDHSKGQSPMPPTPATARSKVDMSFANTPPPSSEKRIAADSLPFGLGESPGFGKQSMADLVKSKGTGGGGGVSSAAKLGKSGKLLKAAKTVQNMVRVTNISAAPRVPALSTAAEREDFEELIKRNDEYFARLLASQAETFDSLTDMVDALTTKLNESAKVRERDAQVHLRQCLIVNDVQCSNDLVSKLSELDELIDEEKRKWKQQVSTLLVFIGVDAFVFFTFVH